MSVPGTDVMQVVHDAYRAWEGGRRRPPVQLRISPNDLLVYNAKGGQQMRVVCDREQAVPTVGDEVRPAALTRWCKHDGAAPCGYCADAGIIAITPRIHAMLNITDDRLQVLVVAGMPRDVWHAVAPPMQDWTGSDAPDEPANFDTCSVSMRVWMVGSVRCWVSERCPHGLVAVTENAPAVLGQMVLAGLL